MQSNSSLTLHSLKETCTPSLVLIEQKMTKLWYGQAIEEMKKK